MAYPSQYIDRELGVQQHWFDLVACEHATHRRETVEDGIEF